MSCSIIFLVLLLTIHFVCSNVVDMCPEDYSDNLTWPKSTIGSVVIPKECTETSFTRICLKDSNIGPYWSKPSGVFTKCETETLYSLAYSKDSISALLKLKRQTPSFSESPICSMQVHYSALILQNFSRKVNTSQSKYWSKIFFRVIDHLIKSSQNCLYQAQTLLNSTDIMLESIDSYVDAVKLRVTYSNNILFFNPDKYPTPNTFGWVAYYQLGFTPLLSNYSLNKVLENNPIIAVSYYADKDNFNFAIFHNTNLFNDDKGIDVHLWVARVIVSNFTYALSDPVQIIFGKLKTLPTNYSCAYWVYGQQDNINIFGSWYSVNTRFVENFVICEYTEPGYYGLISHVKSTQATDAPSSTTTSDPTEKYYCPEERAENITWPKSFIGTVAIPMECTETMYSRVCSYNFDNEAYWKQPSGEFKPCEDPQTLLYELATSNDNEYAIKKFQEAVGNIRDPFLCVTKIYYTALILKKVSHDITVINHEDVQDYFFSIINILHTCSQDCLFDAQINLHSTEIVLDSIHSYFNNFDGTMEWSTIFKDFSYWKQQIEFSSVGLMVFYQQHFRNISSDTVTLMDIINETPDIAVYISDPAIVHGSISFGIFYSTSIFQDDSNIEVYPRVVSITTNFNEPITKPIQIIFARSNLSYDQLSCAQWRYGRNNNISTFGYWYSETNITEYNQNYIVCNFANLEMGYFGLINIPADEIQAPTTVTPRRNDFCAEESMGNITWPHTPIGAVAIPKECSETICSRRCLEDSIQGAFWAKPHGEFTRCRDNTSKIYDLVSSDDSINAIRQLAHIASQFEDELPPMIIKYSALIMKEYSENITAINSNNSLNDFFRVIDNILDSPHQDLAIAQHSVNSTDVILESIDLFLNNFNEDLIINRPKYFMRKHKISSSSIGWIIYNNNTIHSISSETYLFDIVNEELNIAACFSNYTELGENVDVSFVFFADTKLFNDKKKVETYQWLASVDISNKNKTLTYPLHIIFRPSNTSGFQGSCAYWLYGQNKNINIFGSWYDETITEFEGRPLICNYTHMTHFGMLIKETITDNSVLEIITYIGLVLSLFGILSILGSLFLQKNSRSKKNICLILNYLLSIILLPIAAFVSNITTDEVLCSITGMFLHYTIISQSAWTLILATFQYRRYVIVYQTYQKYILNKSLVIGWLTGFIPVIIVTSISIDNYHKNKSHLCYLSQNIINYAVIVPILIINILNLTIFSLIVHNITSPKHNRNNFEFHWQIFKLVHFLFYLFGLSWIFGILLIIYGNIYISYVFTCLTSLQGFCICIHYIITAKNNVLRLKQSMQSSVCTKLL